MNTTEHLDLLLSTLALTLSVYNYVRVRALLKKMIVTSGVVWHKPDGVKEVTIEVWGAGGGGGSKRP